MTVVTSRTFRAGNSEAVRLPREVAFGPDTEVTIVRHGDVVTIYPAKPSPADLVAALRAMPKPDAVEEREPVEAPERPGL
ncbi:antitoxin [Pedomonas mirosovicensis]|uniref:antitoxin n=1 Tax=Pedomonas mirosovicensis TaxID=2908641 RepID=UPI00216A1B5A|nr:AbrB/MazE/SpoVT family DNA-binding domain-containing protein [Pedomonas mirosovicensis]MCH8683938.1 AbrB/MazE/SpoVT family DNA-binding domain-containing protein [Pedomonas mirosovicensis]